MNWFFLALIAPILFSVTNHIDKYLLSRFLKNNGAGSLLIFSSFFGVLVLPIILVFKINAFNIDPINILTLICAGFISGLAIYSYLVALYSTDTSNVVPIFQTIPIFGFILAYFVLGEVLLANQLLASLLIIFGSIIISVEKNNDGRYWLRKRILLLMLLSSFLYACYDTLFKLAAIEESFWVSTFWQIVGFFIIGLVLFSFVRRYRKDFIKLVKENSFRILALNAVNETLNLAGTFLLSFSILLAPIALVTTVGTYQPVFVLIFGFLLTKFFPHIVKEDISRDSIFRKILAIVVILVGTFLLYK